MELLGQVFNIGNKLGYYSLLSILILILLYLLRPKPFKKVIPSLIFLEKSEKRLTMANFFKKFVKDYLFLLQLFLLILICLAALDITVEAVSGRFNSEVVLVIDASASSKATMDGKMLFDHYKAIARKNIGVTNSIVLVKSSPEILVKQTNPAVALSVLSSAKPTDSLSNIWDAMLVSSDLSPGATIVVISDFADTNNRDLLTAKKILEAKGHKVNMINPKNKELSNVGIIKYIQEEDSATVDVKNFDSAARSVRIVNTDSTIEIPPYSVEQFKVKLEEGINKIEIRTDDDLAVDDRINIIVPKPTEGEVLFITNRKTSFVGSALDSIRALSLKRTEPPIVPIENQEVFVIDNINYNSLLPGTIDQLKQRVNSGSFLIIMAQENMEPEKLGDLLPVELSRFLTQDVVIINSDTSEFKDYSFGLSQKYYEGSLKEESNRVIAEVNDKFNSPVIVLSQYGQGHVLYYGILDDYNAFKTSTNYPLFWIKMTELMLSQESGKVNLKVGEIIYGDSIKDPSGRRITNYAVTDTAGIYNVNGEVAVNLLNNEESDINRKTDLQNGEEIEERTAKQSLEILPFLIVLILVLSFLEIYILKRRGDI